MNTLHDRDGEQPRPVYHTPTTSAAKFLEQIVAQGSSSSKSSKSSSNSNRSVQQMNKGASAPPFPPSSSLPLNPPTFLSRTTPAKSNTPPLPPLPSDTPPTVPTPPPPPDDDVRAHHRDRSSKSRTSKKTSKSLPRQLLDELEHIQHRKDSTNGTSPTDSHPRRHHHDHSHGRSRSSPESISSLLVITTERLSQETTRANEAERQATEILALFKQTHEAKAMLERDFHRVREELGLYKLQLDVAQKEIFRAQETVERLDRERVAAEEEAARARDKVNKLSEARAVEHAKQEARWLGFEQGLKEGRMQQSVEVNDDDRYRSRRTRREDGDRVREVSRYTYPEEALGSGSSDSSVDRKSSLKYSEYPQRPASTNTAARRESSVHPRPRRKSSAAAPPSQHPHGTPPDVGLYSDLLPRPTLTTPIPVEVPRTQPQPAPPMPSHQPPNPIHDHSNQPEKIAVQPSRDPNEPIHPIPVHNRTPSIIHERIVPPPDNYIPTMGPDSVISLPPPHEMSMPVAPEPPPPAQPSTSSRPRSASRATDRGERQADSGFRDYPSYRRRGDDAGSLAYTVRSGGHDGRKYATKPTAMSVLSQGSTHLSELDLLSPPRDGEIDYGGKGRRRDEVENPTLRRSMRPRGSSGQPPTERIAEEWRSANKDYLRPISPQQANPIIPRPSSSAARQNPHRPREIVLPAPLTEVMLNTPNKQHANLPPASGELRISTPPPHAERAVSSNTIPGIEVVTPSTHASSRLSEHTIVDPVLLTPESAYRPVPLPTQEEESRDGGLGLYFNPNRVDKPEEEERISMILPDNNLPLGFQPLSPIPGMANLNPYPPGFAPRLPKDYAGSMSPNFTYPSSPLIRPS